MENEAKIDDSDIISKSQLKRDSHALQALGKRLANLSAERFASMPLDDALREAVELARKISNKRGALKRQFQFIGKLLRARDNEPIFAALEALDQNSQESIQKHHLAEHWRDQIVAEGNQAIDAAIAEIDRADRQKLRQLWRNYQHAKTDPKRVQQARLIYQEIKSSL